MSKQYSIDHYEDIDKIEKKHFWFIARSEMLKKIITCKLKNEKCIIGKKLFLEVGCGTGIVIRVLENLGFIVTGMDINHKALEYAIRHTSSKFIRQSFLTYKPPKKYDAIGMFDVIEHISKDEQFLKKAYEDLKKDGTLFLTVPSGMWLWSNLDIAAGHIRRYEPDELVQKLQKAGFSDIWWNYWGVFTLPLLLFWRIVSQFRIQDNDLEVYFKPPKEPFNTWILWLMRIEHMLIFRVKWKFGATLVVIANK